MVTFLDERIHKNFINQIDSNLNDKIKVVMNLKVRI